MFIEEVNVNTLTENLIVFFYVFLVKTLSEQFYVLHFGKIHFDNHLC